MTRMIGYCGYNCHLCAARSDDPAVRQKLVDGWRKIFGHQNYTAENVKCDGCCSDGRVADQQCQARPCARQKGVESCACCDEFPCDKIQHLMGSREGMLIWCRGAASATAEEYDLCMRQFVSMPNLVYAPVSAGKLPRIHCPAIPPRTAVEMAINSTSAIDAEIEHLSPELAAAVEATERPFVPTAPSVAGSI